jgi:transposase-like protein
MAIIKEIFCINHDCKDYGVKNLGNIRTRGKYGKSKEKLLLYCNTCGQRFSHSRSTAFFGLRIPENKITQVIENAAKGVGIRETGRQLNISKDTANRVVLKAEKHCEVVLLNLLASLKIDKSQASTLLSFIEKRKILKESPVLPISPIASQ